MNKSMLKAIAAGKPSCFFRRDPLQTTHIRPQRLWNDHGSIRLLVILENGQPRPPDRQSTSVQRMDELVLGLRSRRLVADIRPPRLERFKIGARRDLPIVLLLR